MENHEGMKQCSKCGKWKELGEFGCYIRKSNHNKLQYDSYCKCCRNKASKISKEKRRIKEIREVVS